MPIINVTDMELSEIKMALHDKAARYRVQAREPAYPGKDPSFAIAWAKQYTEMAEALCKKLG